MSVNILMIPVAMAMMVVMGKENFDKWVESLIVRIPTNFNDHDDLVKTVKKAGFDAEDWGTSVKTHIEPNGSFIFWELKNNIWEAIFAKDLLKVKGAEFMSILESSSDRNIFVRNPESKKVVLSHNKTFPTNFRDGETLKTVLKKLGYKPEEHANDSIICFIGPVKLTFLPGISSTYSVQVENYPEQATYLTLSSIDKEYKRCIQTQTYEKIMSKAEEKGLTVESEEVLEDDSITITLLINQ